MADREAHRGMVARLRSFHASATERARQLRATLEGRRPLNATEADLASAWAVVDAYEDELAVAMTYIEGLAEHCATTESEDALAALAFLELPEAALVTTRSGMIRDANHAAARALHVPRAFLRERLLVGFVARRDCRKFRGLLHQANDAPQVERVMLRPRHQGTPFEVVMRVAPSDAGHLVWTFASVDVGLAAGGTIGAPHALDGHAPRISGVEAR